MLKMPQRDLLNSISLSGFGLTRNKTRIRNPKAAQKTMAARFCPTRSTDRGRRAAIKPSKNDSSNLWGTIVFFTSHSRNQMSNLFHPVVQLFNPSVDIDLPPVIYGQDARSISNGLTTLRR